MRDDFPLQMTTPIGQTAPYVHRFQWFNPEQV